MRILRPSRDKLVIQPPKQAPNKAGIDLARASRERPLFGTVIAAGKDVTEYKVGDEVTFTRFGPNEVELDDETYYVLEEKQILAGVVEKETK